MICPYCDSLIRDLSDNRVCPFCGAPLSQDVKQAQEKQKLVFPTPPLGIYENQLGHHIEITKEAIVFRTRSELSGPLSRIRVVPYSKLVKVMIRPGGILKAGYLSVLDEEDKYKLLPQRVWDAVDDDATITFNRSYYSQFYKVYLFLKQCVDIVNAAKE